MVFPPEIIRLIAHDEDLDKVQIQKAATPVDGRSDLPRAAELLAQSRPNAVVLEKSSYDEADINAQRISALHNVVEQLRAEVSGTMARTSTRSLSFDWPGKKAQSRR